MRGANPRAGTSGWAWGSERPPAPLPPTPSRPPRGGGTVGALLAAGLFLGVVAAGAAVALVRTDEREASGTRADDESPAPAAGAHAGVSESVAAASPGAPRPAVPQTQRPAPSLQSIAWTSPTRSTLDELARAWSIPRAVLAELNPDLRKQTWIAAGVAVVVYADTQGASSSVGPPNDGKLIGAVPLPEGGAWAFPEDRTRAFATAETIAAITAALEAYGAQFPDAEPVQVGDLSARRGGPIYGHESHQSGRDVDVRLVLDRTGEGFDAERNWFLVKTVIDGGEVDSIFLNRTEQAWLRSAAEADVGGAEADRYFAVISHEPGHTIHMHIRFACPDADKRCVAYSQPDAGEQDAKAIRKLPVRPGGLSTRGASKLPRVSRPGSQRAR